MSEAVFLFLAAFTLASALVVVLNNQLLYSAIALLFNLFGVAGLYVFLYADFIAAAQVFIYVGGILVLIIFGVMLTNKIDDPNLSNLSKNQLVAAIFCLILFVFQIQNSFHLHSK